jgi:hypothetical protein
MERLVLVDRRNFRFFNGFMVSSIERWSFTNGTLQRASVLSPQLALGEFVRSIQTLADWAGAGGEGGGSDEEVVSGYTT